MDAIAAILSRRSIRKYTDQPVSEKLLTELLKAAMAAPSAGNSQPWRFLVIRDKELLAKIPEFHPYAKMAPQAQAAILICADLRAEKYPGFWVQDCSAATQNLLVAACANGIGAVWAGIYPDMARVQGCRKLFNLPENVMPLALVPLGYPDESQPLRENFDTNKIHYDRWKQD